MGEVSSGFGSRTTRNMRVAYIILSSDIHGAEKRVLKISLNAEKDSEGKIKSYLILNQKLYNAAKKDFELKSLVEKNFDKIKVLSDFTLLPKDLRKIMYLMITFYFTLKYRIEYLHTYLGAKYLMMPLSYVGIKIIIELTSPDVANSFISNYSKRKFLYKRLHRVNCVTESVYKRVISELPAHPDGVNLVYMNLTYTNAQIIKGNLLTQKENIVICASRFIERKNVKVFAIGIKVFLKSKPNWKVKIFGSGPLETEINQILENEIKVGLANVSYTNNIINEFKKSKIVVSLIDPDNYPSQSLFEAMANGNALLVSDTGLSEQFVLGNNGVLTSKDAFVNDLIKMTEDEEMLSSMMRNSIDHFNNKFNKHAYFNELIKNCYT